MLLDGFLDRIKDARFVAAHQIMAFAVLITGDAIHGKFGVDVPFGRHFLEVQSHLLIAEEVHASYIGHGSHLLHQCCHMGACLHIGFQSVPRSF